MNLALAHSRARVGVLAPAVRVEAHLGGGLPNFTLVGMPATAVRESRERVRSAIANAGLEFPSNKRITVNLAPADLPKDSGRFDLPIALGILAASGQIDGAKLAGFEFAGELSQGGDLRPAMSVLDETGAYRRLANGTEARYLLPVGAILWVSVVTLGSGALKDLALALFVGMAAGLYSSVFIASAVLLDLLKGKDASKA